jgi:hypothetical protein
MSDLLLGVIIGFCVALLTVVAVPFTMFLRRKLQRHHEEQLRLLERHKERLKVIVGDLLAKADEVDAATKYLRNQVDDDTQQRLAETCRELVLLGDVTKTIEDLLKTRNVGATRQALLHACELAAHDSRKLRAIKHAVRDLERRRSELGSGDAT